MRLTGKNKDGRYGFITENNTLGIFDENSWADKHYTKLGQYEDIDDDPEHLEKEHKALEIIKKKKVNVSALLAMSLKTYNEYAEYVWISPTLTKEEYDLLKEVLS